MFSLLLNSFADGGGGELLFGGVNNSHIEGELPPQVKNAHFWNAIVF